MSSEIVRTLESKSETQRICDACQTLFNGSRQKRFCRRPECDKDRERKRWRDRKGFKIGASWDRVAEAWSIVSKDGSEFYVFTVDDAILSIRGAA